MHLESMIITDDIPPPMILMQSQRVPRIMRKKKHKKYTNEHQGARMASIIAQNLPYFRDKHNVKRKTLPPEKRQ